ncbi:MAG: STAS domain-containing protein [Pseudonocardiaceae bacterium]
MTPVVHDQLETLIETLTPAPPLGGPMVIATLSCPQPDTTVCRVTGSVDLVTAPVLVDRLIEAVHDGRPHVVIDLSAVSVLDSIGLQAVFEALDRYDIEGHLAVVADPRSTAISRPDLSGLGELVDIHHDLASALRVCARASISNGGRHRAAATN